VVAVDLRAEAAAEVRRLTRARALLRDGDEAALAQLGAAAAWIAIPRRTSLRRALGRKLCLVWRVAVEDASGRIVESRLVAVLLAVPAVGKPMAPAARRAWLLSLLRRSEEFVRPVVEAACEDWQAEVARITHAFTSARLRREQEIAPRTATADIAGQPGLFDRRTDRSNRARAQAAREAERAAIERRRAIDSGGTIAPRPATLLLVLAP
jgi:hypothetical protein